MKGNSDDASLMVDVTIFGRQYKVACNENERAELAEAVTYLDQKMREIRDRGKVAGVDRIAVMAALNIAHDLLRERQSIGVRGGHASTNGVSRRGVDGRWIPGVGRARRGRRGLSVYQRSAAR